MPVPGIRGRVSSCIVTYPGASNRNCLKNNEFCPKTGLRHSSLFMTIVSP